MSTSYLDRYDFDTNDWGSGAVDLLRKHGSKTAEELKVQGKLATQLFPLAFNYIYFNGLNTYPASFKPSNSFFYFVG